MSKLDPIKLQAKILEIISDDIDAVIASKETRLKDISKKIQEDSKSTDPKVLQDVLVLEKMEFNLDTELTELQHTRAELIKDAKAVMSTYSHALNARDILATINPAITAIHSMSEAVFVRVPALRAAQTDLLQLQLMKTREVAALNDIIRNNPKLAKVLVV